MLAAHSKPPVQPKTPSVIKSDPSTCIPSGLLGILTGSSARCNIYVIALLYRSDKSGTTINNLLCQAHSNSFY